MTTPWNGYPPDRERDGWWWVEFVAEDGTRQQAAFEWNTGCQLPWAWARDRQGQLLGPCLPPDPDMVTVRREDLCKVIRKPHETACPTRHAAYARVVAAAGCKAWWAADLVAQDDARVAKGLPRWADMVPGKIYRGVYTSPDGSKAEWTAQDRHETWRWLP